MTPSPSVAIVILNWNGRHYLEKFLPSVLSTAYANYRIVVADNASTDGSADLVRDQFPQVELMVLSQNFGFAKGYNEALKKIRADYYVLLNSDVEVTPAWLQPVIELLENNDAAAACQPKILSYSKKNVFEYAGAAGGWIDAYGYPFARGRVFDVCEEDRGQYNTTQEVFWATGAAMVVKSRVFQQLNGFDDYFFAHMEEIDLCWRMQLAGYKIYCCPQSMVYHLGGGTLPKGASRKTFLNFRNNQIMLAKNLSWKEKWWKIPFRMGLDQISAVKSLLSGDAGYFRAVIKAHLAFLRWLFFVKKKKGPLPKKPLKELSGVYGGNIIWSYFLKKKSCSVRSFRGKRKKGANLFNNLHTSIIFAPQNFTMDYRQEEYQQELEKVQDRDFTHNWVSSSAFLFYLSVFCLLAFFFGSCYKLYNIRYENSKPQNVVVQESTLYTPKYSAPQITEFFCCNWFNTYFCNPLKFLSTRK